MAKLGLMATYISHRCHCFELGFHEKIKIYIFVSSYTFEIVDFRKKNEKKTKVILTLKNVPF